jgi:sugar transferase (PEP-CTERM system associated)
MQLRLFRHFVPISVVLLVSSDALLIAGAFYHMLSQTGAGSATGFSPTQLSAQLTAATVVAMLSVGLYRQDSFLSFRVLAAKLGVVSGIVLAAAALAAAWWRSGIVEFASLDDLPLKATLIWLACVAVTRGTFLMTLGRGLLQRRILVLGHGRQAARIEKLVENRANQHFVPLSYLAMPGEAAAVRSSNSEWSTMEPDALAELGYRLGASEIVVATDDRRGLPVEQLLHCKLSGIRVTDFLDFWERETRTVDLEALRPSWLFYSDGFRCGILNEVVKRSFDIIVSLAMLTFTLPLLFVTACLIKLDSRGPVFYRQERVGLHGRIFTILKFRSMRADAEQGVGPRWASERDPRITRVGAIIRKLRIDELAQILNVLRGDMSFVGPRPERPFFVAELTGEIPYYAERHWARPGITGWAQINFPYGASTEDARRKLAYDLYYVKNQSVFLDLLILLQTARVIFWNHGAR